MPPLTALTAPAATAEVERLRRSLAGSTTRYRTAWIRPDDGANLDHSNSAGPDEEAGRQNHPSRPAPPGACEDFVMLVTLTPGVDRNHVLELLRAASTEIVNNHGSQDSYVQWVLDHGRLLRGQIARSDLDQLLFTPAFYRLVDPALMGTPQGRQLLEAEISERQALLTAAFTTLQDQIRAWTTAKGMALAVVDSSVFLAHPAWTRDDDPAAVIASIPWAHELGVGFDDVLLVLPEVVIRELDRLKESGNQKTRYRASVTLAVIDKLLAKPEGTVMIRARTTTGMRSVRAKRCPAARSNYGSSMTTQRIDRLPMRTRRSSIGRWRCRPSPRHRSGSSPWTREWDSTLAGPGC